MGLREGEFLAIMQREKRVCVNERLRETNGKETGPKLEAWREEKVEFPGKTEDSHGGDRMSG